MDKTFMGLKFQSVCRDEYSGSTTWFNHHQAQRMKKILIIEDTANDRYLYQKYLENEGYELFEVEYADKALDFLKDQKIDLILLDWKLPRMTGEQFLKIFKADESLNTIPVIVITSFDVEQVIPNSLNYDYVDFISKPITMTELTARIKKMLRGQDKEKKIQSEIADGRSKMATLGIQNDQVNSNIKELKQSILKVQTLLSKDSIHEEAVMALKKIGRKIEGLESNQGRLNQVNDVYGVLEPEFINHLHELSPKLTPLDIKHCMYLRMNLMNDEISSIFNIDSKSVQMRTYRLRKKLKLEPAQDLRKFIAAI